MADEVNKPNDSEGKAPDSPTPPSSDAGQPDEQQLRVISAVGYLGILFLLPYLMFPREKFAVFHANQSLVLLIFSVALQVVVNVLGLVTFGIGLLLGPLAWIATLALLIVGAVNAFNGHMKRLPLIGSFDLLKFNEGK